MEAVEDAGQTHCFSPQGGRDGVDGTQLWNQDLRNMTRLLERECRRTEIKKTM